MCGQITDTEIACDCEEGEEEGEEERGWEIEREC